MVWFDWWGSWFESRLEYYLCTIEFCSDEVSSLYHCNRGFKIKGVLIIDESNYFSFILEHCLVLKLTNQLLEMKNTSFCLTKSLEVNKGILKTCETIHYCLNSNKNQQFTIRRRRKWIILEVNIWKADFSFTKNYRYKEFKCKNHFMLTFYTFCACCTQCC